MLIRPTTIIVMIAFWLYSSSEEIGRAFGKIARAVTVIMTGFVFAGLNTAVNHQRVVLILKQEGDTKGPHSCLSIWA